MRPMPRRFDKLFSIIVLDFNRYVDIMKPKVLIAAQTIMRAGTIHASICRVRNPKPVIIAPKKTRLGIESSRGARAIPRA